MAEKIQVLYVDDERILLELCKTYLERSGDFIVTTVPGAPEAIRILELAKFDAIVSDYQMPVMDGIEFLKTVRSRGDKTPFIIFTGKGREEVVIEALNSGADFYIQKGGEPKSQFTELSHKIRRAVSSRQSDKALSESEKRYRTVFENTGSATVIVEENTIISLANAGFEHLSGFSKEELEGKKRWTEFVVKEDLARMQNQHKLRRVDREKALRQYEFRFITRSGDIRDIFLIIDLIPGTKKSVASLIDITGQKSVEGKLRETNEYLHKLIDFGNAPVIVWDPDFRITRFNHAMERLTGKDEQEVIGQPLDIQFPEELRETSLALIKRTIAGERWETVEIPVLASDGTVRTILWNTANILSDEAELISTIAQGVDITDRKQAEEALRESEGQFRALSENSQDYIMRYDKEHRHIYANPSCLRVAGMTAEQFIGKTHRELGFSPDLCDLWEAAIDRVFATGKPYGETFAWTGVDGEVVLDWRLFPEKDDGGRVISLLGVARDITDTRKSEISLLESEERFRALVENTSDIIRILDREGRIIFDTAATGRELGYPPGYTLSRSPFEFIHPDDIARVKQDLSQVYEKTNTGIPTEFRIQKADGSYVWVESVGKNLIGVPGVDGVVITTHIINERKLAETALRESEARLDLALRSAEMGVWHWDIKKDKRCFDAQTCRLLGIDPATFSGAAGEFFSIVHPDDRENLKKLLARTIEHDVLYMPSYRVIWSDGSTHWITARGRLVKDSSGKPDRIQGIIWDITKRKKVEEDLQAAREKYTKAFLSVPDAITITDLDSGRFIEVNDATTRIFGYSRDELIGKSTVELGIWRDKKSRDRLIGQVREHGRVSQFEVVNWRKSGESFIALVNADTISIGNVHYLIAVIRDITDRKNIEAALIKSEVKSRSILEHLPELILVHRNGIIQYTNPAAVKTLGYQPDDVVNRQVTDFISPEFHERVAEAVRLRMSGKEVEPYEIEVVGKDGSHRNMVVSGSTIEFDGAPASLIILTDITGRKKVEEKLKRSEARLRAVVEDQTEFICRFTPDGRLTFVNEAYCRYFGLDRKACLARPHLVTLLPEDARLMKKHLASLTPQNPVATIDHRIIMPSGEGRWQRWNDRAIFDNNGTVIEYQSVGRDITEKQVVELALRESEKRFEQIAESAGEWIWEVDANGMYTFSNAMVYQILGYSPEEIIGKMHFYDLFLPEDRDQLKEGAFKAFANREPFKGFVNANLHKHGNRVILETSGFPIFDDEGNLTGYRGTDIDITSRMNAEEALRKSERELADIISFLPDATFVIDKNGTVIAWNRAIEEMTGVPAEQIVGKAEYEYALPFYNERRPITLDLVLHYDPVVVAKYPYMRKEGNSLLSEIYIPHLNKGKGAHLWFKASPLFDANGNISGAIESIRDITNQKRAEEELHVTHEKYTKAFLSAPDAIAISELDSGRFIEVNDAATRMFGYSREELIGKNATELGILLHKEDREHLINLLKTQGRVSQFELVERRKSGELYNAQINADTVSIGKVPYLITIVRDITEQKKAEAALQESEERYSSIFDNNYSVSLLIDPDTGKIVDANAAAAWYYGYTHDSLTSMGIYDLNRLPKERVIANLQRAKDKKAKHFYSTHYLANGELRYVEIYSGPITLLGKPLFYSIIHDITERKRAEEALKQKEAELHDILEGSPIPNFVIDRNHQVISWNKALEEATGIKAKDMLGTNQHWRAFYDRGRPCLADLLVDGKIDTIQKWYAGKIDAVRQAGGIFDGTDFFPHLGNNGKWLHFSASVIRDDRGNIIGAVETLNDITEQKRAEKEIHSLQQFQQSIIDNANVWISVLDPKGSILVWNTTAEQISGYPAEDVIGKNTIWKQLYPDPVYRKQVADNILDIIKKNTYVENFETRIRTKSGDEKIIWWNTQPLRDASGKPVRFITIGRDNTERRRSEERLRSLRQFEESVIKNANIWISVLDGKGNVSVWNRAAETISGYTADEVVGKNTIWSRMYPDKDYRRTVTATIKEVIGSKKYLENFETRIQTKDGQERIIWWNTRTLQDVPGIDETFIAIGKDVTEQKTLSDAVTLANRKLNLLSSITRHDILNQLMALKGFLELSGDVLNDPVKLANYIATEQKIANTIQDQIQFTKDYEEMGIKAPEWQNIHDSVDKAKKSLPLGEIAVETDSPSLEVYADPLFMRVFYNLIDNALRYGGGQLKTIRVSSQESDRGLVIVCEDDGIGVPADKKDAIFKQGYFKHTGLGLFLSREILGITHITITENGTLGKGARFEITVPKGMYRLKAEHE